MASPSAFSGNESIKTISVNSPLCIRAKQDAAPEEPHPTIATFL
jgi:hypothetical protein